MKAIIAQSIRQSFRENMTAYHESYPIAGNNPTDDALRSLISWVENSYFFIDEYGDDGSKGKLSEWFDIVLNEYIAYFDFPNSALTYCENRIKQL